MIKTAFRKQLLWLLCIRVNSAELKSRCPSPSLLNCRMSLHVQRQVVGPGEGPLAELTLKGAVTGVLAKVSRQLIGPGKLPAAALPAALVRFLAGMGPQVSLQVGGLGVGLAAARVGAGVRGDLLGAAVVCGRRS